MRIREKQSECWARRSNVRDIHVGSKCQLCDIFQISGNRWTENGPDGLTRSDVGRKTRQWLWWRSRRWWESALSFSGNSGYSIGIGDKLLEWGLKNCEHCEDSEHRWSGWEGRVSKHAAASYSTSSSALLTCLVKTGITTYICGVRKWALEMMVQCESD